MGDPKNGMCGSLCPKTGPEISTIYIVNGDPVVEPEQSDPPTPLPVVSPIVSPAVSPVVVPSMIEVSSASSSTFGSFATPPIQGSLSVCNALTPSSVTPLQRPTPVVTSPQLPKDPPQGPAPVVTAKPPANRVKDPKPDTTVPAPRKSQVPPRFNGTVPNTERDGDPPAPSQVPKSEAAPLHRRTISILGGLAFIVAVAA